MGFLKWLQSPKELGIADRVPQKSVQEMLQAILDPANCSTEGDKVKVKFAQGYETAKGWDVGNMAREANAFLTISTAKKRLQELVPEISLEHFESGHTKGFIMSQADFDKAHAAVDAIKQDFPKYRTEPSFKR